MPVRTLLAALTLFVFAETAVLVGAGRRPGVAWVNVLVVLRVSLDAAAFVPEVMREVSLMRLGVFGSALLDGLMPFFDRTAALSLLGFSFSATSLDCSVGTQGN